MKKIIVSDVSFFVAEEIKKELTFREKLNIAACLDDCGVDVIELPEVTCDKESAVIYKTIASTVKKCGINVSVSNSENIEASWNMIKDAKNPKIQVVLPISTVQMEYQYHLKAAVMLQKIGELCANAKNLGASVEFVAKDATRAEEGFLAECALIAYENGAEAVTVCDDSGSFFPEDFVATVQAIKAKCDIKVYVQPSNALNMAAACATEAVKAGADGVKTAIFGNMLTADSLADIFRAKGDKLNGKISLDSTKIHHALNQMCSTCAVEGVESIASDGNSTVLDNNSTIKDIAVNARALGYELSDEDCGKVFEEFKRVCAKKSSIGTKELEAIIATSAMQVPSTYHLVSYVVNSGNIITATANIVLERDGETLSGVSTGDGPIDAAFHAIEQIVGHHYELDDFQIQSVTKGREAMGSSLIRLRASGKLYSGNGISTDIIGACIRAYINALNKIVYEEN